MRKLFLISFIFLLSFAQGQNCNLMFSYISAAAAWQPTDIAGCKLWLDAGQGITKDINDYVSNWTDESLNGNDATQGTGANQPLWVDNQLNGLPGIKFNAVAQFMEFTSGFLYNYPQFTILFVIKPTLGANGGIFAPTNTTGTGIHIISYGGGYVGINGAYPYVTGFFTNNTFTISTLTYSDVSTQGYNNGVPLAPNYGGVPLTFNGVYAIGKYAGSYYGGPFDLAEIIIYDSALGTTDRETVENYLMAKYNLNVEWYIVGGLLIGLCYRRKIFYNQFKNAA